MVTDVELVSEGVDVISGVKLCVIECVNVTEFDRVIEIGADGVSEIVF